MRREAAQQMKFDPDRVFYHSTFADIKEFDPAKIKEHGKFGKGFYFSEDPKYAERFTGIRKELDKNSDRLAPNTIPVHLKMENPLVINTGLTSPTVGTAPFKLGAMFPDAKNVDDVTAGVKAAGHDAIVIQDSNGRILENIVFEPNQIRSVSAKFDPESASSRNILASAAPVAAGGILAALGMPERATAAETAISPDYLNVDKKQGSGEIQQMILDALLGFLAPSQIGDATMDAYNRNRGK
jgi:hypothetical protein